MNEPTTEIDPEAVRMWMKLLSSLHDEELQYHAGSKSPTVREAATRLLAQRVEITERTAE